MNMFQIGTLRNEEKKKSASVETKNYRQDTLTSTKGGSQRDNKEYPDGTAAVRHRESRLPGFI
jgi:hypothetical protein